MADDTTDRATNKATDPQAPPFFVGYLPMPTALKWFYWPLAVVLIVACGVAGYWVATQQKSTGPASWETTKTTTIGGVLTLAPYPVLHRFNPEQPGKVESILLVYQGKHAADRFSVGFDRQPVAVEGYEIRRGGWIMLEIVAENPIRKAVETDRVKVDEITPLLEIKSLGEVSLAGEVADSKCFLGVMRPGAGKIHKACAEICLLGGIPPLLVAKNAHHQKYGYLIAHADGSGAAELLARYVAEPVQISGQLQQQGDLLYIAMDDNGIRRL